MAAVARSGWYPVPLDPGRAHPFRLRAVRGRASIYCKVYIWNLTHGGGAARPADEYRIQVTGVTSFEKEPQGETLILGWWAKHQVFAAYDLQHHIGELGSSPSMQIRQNALLDASRHGIGTHVKDSGEIAVAFRPDLFMHYVQNLHSLHTFGESRHDAGVLSAVAADPYAVGDEVVASVAASRRMAVVTIREVLRDRSFRERVLTAYGQQCALCSLQMELPEAAHIVPVAVEGSTDETCNGIAFCPTHHKAYDIGLVTIADDYRVLLSRARARELRRSRLHGGIAEFEAALRDEIVVPPERAQRPRVEFLRKGREIRGWVG